MKTNILISGCLALSNVVLGQGIPKEYTALCKKADSLYTAEDYVNSAHTYSSAFKVLGWKGYVTDRYNAACSWALAGVPDSAFFNLNRCIFGGYMNYNHISSDADLTSLYNDQRWEVILQKVKENKEKAEAELNQPLVKLLDSIYDDDQVERKQMHAYSLSGQMESIEAKTLSKSIHIKDSINLIKVTKILDTYGWLGPQEIGEQGNSALFLVIQHADQATQEKYLPMMREAVKNKRAHASSLALLEDRVLLKQGKKQIYGSQIGTDYKNNTFYVRPLEDPEHVDERRLSVGLGPLKDYVIRWRIEWDVETYKKEQAVREAELSEQKIIKTAGKKD